MINDERRGPDHGRSAWPDDISRRSFLRTASGAAALFAAAGTASHDEALTAAFESAAGARRSEICRMDAVTLAGHVRAKRLSPVEVIEAVLDRMDQLEPNIHAFCTPTPDLAHREARRVEAEIMAGRPVGVLAGVPVGIKDLLFTKGIRTTGGSVIYQDFVPDEDDVVVERLKAADAIIIGKTNTPEFGYSAVGHNMIFPATRNPWNTERTSGGSSAGSAAAVASGMGPLAIGSDGGGSIRIPAALCGIYGLKPAMGRVPLYPGCRDERFPGASSFESLGHIGPLSRTVADAALMMSVIAGPDDRDRHSLPEPGFKWVDTLRGGLEGLRIAYSPDWGYAPVDHDVRAVVDRAVRVFERDLGCTVEVAHPGFEVPRDAFRALVVLECDVTAMRRLVDQYGSKMMPHIVQGARVPWTAENFADAIVLRKTVANKMWRFMRKYDLLLTPTTAVTAFELGVLEPETIDGKKGSFDWAPFTNPLNLTGQPAASVPAGFTPDGLPAGLQIVGRHLDDPLVLRASAAFEAAAPWKDRWPPLLGQRHL